MRSGTRVDTFCIGILVGTLCIGTLVGTLDSTLERPQAPRVSVPGARAIASAAACIVAASPSSAASESVSCAPENLTPVVETED